MALTKMGNILSHYFHPFSLINGIWAKKCGFVYSAVTYRFNKKERKPIYPFNGSQHMNVHRWNCKEKKSHLYSPLYFNCMLLSTFVWIIFFRLRFYLAVFPSSQARFTISQVLVIVWKVSNMFGRWKLV